MKDDELRDDFAGLAMQAFVSSTKTEMFTVGAIASAAYRQADAMLAARKSVKSLEDVWGIIVEMCVITEAVVPDRNDIRATLNRLIDYHVFVNAAIMEKTE